MTHEDLKRFYPNSSNDERSNDFARYDSDGRLQSASSVHNHGRIEVVTTWRKRLPNR